MRLDDLDQGAHPDRPLITTRSAPQRGGLHSRPATVPRCERPPAGSPSTRRPHRRGETPPQALPASPWGPGPAPRCPARTLQRIGPWLEQRPHPPAARPVRGNKYPSQSRHRASSTAVRARGTAPDLTGGRSSQSAGPGGAFRALRASACPRTCCWANAAAPPSTVGAVSGWAYRRFGWVTSGTCGGSTAVRRMLACGPRPVGRREGNGDLKPSSRAFAQAEGAVVEVDLLVDEGEAETGSG